MKRPLLFGLLAMTALMSFGQSAQAGCYRRGWGCGRSYYVSRCYTPCYRYSSCYAPACYSAPCVTTACAPINPIVTTPVCATNACANGLPGCTQVYYTNR